MFGFSLAARRITTALGAAALALGAITATALPARANGDDIAKVLAGTAALVIIGSALNANKHPRQAPPVTQAWHPDRYPGWHHDRRDRPDGRGGWHHPKPQPRHGWAPPPRAQEPCVMWINGQRYIQDSRSCGGRNPRPVPHGYPLR